MESHEFTKPFGRLVKNKDGYITFVPKDLPPQLNYDESLTALLSEASLQLGKLSGIGKLMSNPHLLIRPYLRREATLSSKIEGTQASLLDIFKYEVGSVVEGKEKRVNEVINYIRALEQCLEDLQNGAEIDLMMIKNAHRILMQNVRGQEEQPGKFREVQNWIGIEGTPIEDATFVPPPPEYIDQLMVGLERFIKDPPGRIPILIQCAMIHYMFEAIHPFRDGNGRIGRLLIPVLLAQRGILEQPLLYLSAYIESNKEKYYSLLLNVSQKSEWVEWIRFFLIGVMNQAKDAIDNIQKLVSLKDTYEQKLRSKRASGSTTRLVNYLFANPIITIPTAAKYLQITYSAAKNALEYLKEVGILTEMSERRRGRIFVAEEVLSILESK